MVSKNILKIIANLFGGTKKLHYLCVTKAINRTKSGETTIKTFILLWLL
jgi:hypothetical protein